MASHIGATKNAIKQKLANMLYTTTNGQKGLSNYSQDSSAIFDFRTEPANKYSQIAIFIKLTNTKIN